MNPARIIIFLAVIGMAPMCFAQSAGGGGPMVPEHFARNAIYVEGLGNGLSLSINFDRRILEAFSVRVGAGFYIADSGQYPNNRSLIVPTVPIMAHWFVGGNHKLELGAGVALQLRSTACEGYAPPLSCSTVKPTIVVGYRYQARDGGVVFRTGFTPVWYGPGIYWGAGMSIGAAF